MVLKYKPDSDSACSELPTPRVEPLSRPSPTPSSLPGRQLFIWGRPLTPPIPWTPGPHHFLGSVTATLTEFMCLPYRRDSGGGCKRRAQPGPSHTRCPGNAHRATRGRLGRAQTTGVLSPRLQRLVLREEVVRSKGALQAERTRLGPQPRLCSSSQQVWPVFSVERPGHVQGTHTLTSGSPAAPR